MPAGAWGGHSPARRAADAAPAQAVSYAEIRAAAGVSAEQDVEDLVLSALYAGVVEGQIDQQGQVFEVSAAIGRDVPRGSADALDALLGKLRGWCVLARPLSTPPVCAAWAPAG